MTKILIVVGSVVILMMLIAKIRGAGPAIADLPPEGERSDADIRRLLTLDRKIEAIKIYREVHGVGLREAKESVERMQREM